MSASIEDRKAKRREQLRAWRKANPEKMRAYSRAWYQRNKHHPNRVEREQEKAARRRKKKTGFCPELFATALALQAGVCAICEVELEPIKQCADHDHATGNPRGVLCNRCNLAISLFNDRPDLLRAAIAYLEDPPISGIEDLL